MRTVQDAYDAYRIMPSLQLHQLRVGAAGKLICEHFSEPLDANAAILACLFHDMGNIIKSDLIVFPDFLQPEGLAYWQSVKDDFVSKWGNDEHNATNGITGEIGLSEHVRDIIDDARFSRLEATRDGTSFEKKIEKYCDLRAGPFGVLSLDERLAEGKARYAKKKGYDTPEGRERYQRSSDAAHEIERQLFARCSIKPEDINDSSVTPLLTELRKYPIA